MDRQTIDITLPDSKAKVTLYSTLTYGDFRQLQRQMLKEINLDMSRVAEGDNDPEKAQQAIKDSIKSISGLMVLNEEDLVLSLLIKEVTDSEGQKIQDISGFLYNLSGVDGPLLYKEADRISKESNLTPEGKKK